MEIIDFLFSNIAFLVAIIWFIASIFSKKQKEEQERNKHPRPVARPVEDPRPVARPIELDDIPWEKIEPAREEPSFSRQENPDADKMRQRTEELLARAERIQSRESFQHRERAEQQRDRVDRKQVTASPQFSSAQASNVINLSNLNRNNVVQGMVWSQVFGLPRAKDPHRTSRAYMGSRLPRTK